MYDKRIFYVAQNDVFILTMLNAVREALNEYTI